MSGLEAGSTLGGYKILARLRAGAMGALYLARRVGPAGFARPVAIKVIHDHLAQNKRFSRMFIAEAKLSARIDDPHVARVEEFGEADGRYYLVMELVNGVSLAQALGIMKKRGGIPLDVAVAIAMDVASGLHAAHEATDEDGQPLGIVHRDVSPHNVLVSYKGYVKVIDFGIAKAKESAGQTLTGSIRGKLAYMPPEQARSAKHVDRRADLYALGLVIWEMLAGRRMFDGTSDIALLNQIKNPVVVPPSSVNPRVPKELDDVVLTLLEQDPEKRPPTAATVARLLANARPSATKVLAADIAAVMDEVREAATSAKADPKAEEDDDGSTVYGEEVKKSLGIFRRSLELDESAGEDPESGLADIGQDKTEVMTKPPVAKPSGAPPKAKDTLEMKGPGSSPALVEEDETTARVTPGHGHRIPRHTGNQGKTIPFMGASPAHAVKEHPSSRLAAPAVPALMPAWVTPPVLVLGATTLALAVALVVVQCSSRSAPTPPVASLPSPVAPSPVVPASTAPVDANGSPLARAQKAALDGNPAAVRQILEGRVFSGHATAEEARLLRAACKQMGDTACAAEVKAKYP